MPLPASAADRKPEHRRTIDVQVYSRGDGLWEVDATVRDVKTHDTMLAGKNRPAGTPIHDMLLRLVIDTRFNVLAAGSQTLWMPYPGHCNRYGPSDATSETDAYAQLAGLNLLQGFRKAVRERLSGVRGCTHLTELAEVLPTVVIQAFAGTVIDTQGARDGAEQPFQIDRCHALRADGEVVRLHYPRWHRPAAAAPAAHNARSCITAPAASAPPPER